MSKPSGAAAPPASAAPTWGVSAGALVATSAGMGFSQASLMVSSFGIFIYPLALAFDWNRAEIAFGLTLSTLALALVTPLTGSLVDRHGTFRVLLLAGPAFGLCLASFAWLDGSLPAFYGLCVLTTICGAGTNSMTYTRMITGLFRQRLGLALGLAMSGVGIIAAAIPPLGQWLMSVTDWRMTYAAFGAVGLAVPLLIVRYLSGGTLDAVGRPAPAQSPVQGAFPEADVLTMLRRFASDPNFLVLVALFVLVSIGFTATNIHFMPLLLDRGMPAQLAATHVSLIGIGLVVGRVVAGALMDRFFAPRVALALFLITALGMGGIYLDVSGPLLIVCALTLGFGTAAEMDLMAFLTARYFPAADYGKVYGLFYSCFMVGASLGPFLMGVAFEVFGSYQQPLLVNIGLLVSASLLTLLLGDYKKPPSS